MTRFNRTFYDLNESRGYCVDTPGLPPEILADLKLSVPNFEETLWLAGVYLAGETVRLIFTAGSENRDTKPVATFTSDARSAVRCGEPYPLTVLVEGYGGLIVFGRGLRSDVDFREPMRISEECLTRYEPSRIPYAALTCREEHLTGEVWISGGERLVSDGTDVPAEMFTADRALQLSLLDTETLDPENPMIATANGINGDFGTGKSGIFKLFGALPDESGTVTLLFDEHFHFAAVGDPNEAPSTLALGTGFTTDEICNMLNEAPDDTIEPERQCDPTDILFETISPLS